MKNGNDYLGLFTDSIGYEDNFAQVSKYISDNYVNSIKDRFITGEGATSNALAKEYNIPRSTVKNWFAKTNNGIDVLIDRRPQYSGRIANLDTDYKQRYEILKKMEDFLMLQQGRKPSL